MGLSVMCRPVEFTYEDFRMCVNLMNCGITQEFIAENVYGILQWSLSQKMHNFLKRSRLQQ